MMTVRRQTRNLADEGQTYQIASDGGEGNLRDLS